MLVCALSLVREMQVVLLYNALKPSCQVGGVMIMVILWCHHEFNMCGPQLWHAVRAGSILPQSKRNGEITYMCFDHLFVFTSHNCIHCISNVHCHYYEFVSGWQTPQWNKSEKSCSKCIVCSFPECWGGCYICLRLPLKLAFS